MRLLDLLGSICAVMIVLVFIAIITTIFLFMLNVTIKLLCALLIILAIYTVINKYRDKPKS